MSSSDNVSAAPDLSAGGALTSGTGTWDNLTATDNAGEPLNLDSAGSNVWQKVYLVAAGTYRFEHDPAFDGDTVMALYQGPADAAYVDLVRVAWDDDLAGNLHPQIDWVSAGSEWIYIESTGYHGGPVSGQVTTFTIRYPFDRYPASRLHYDLDGTRLCTVVAGVSAEQSLADLRLLNNEANDSLDPALTYVLVFPTARRIEWLYVYLGGSGTYDFAFSLDSTDGADGSWSADQSLSSSSAGSSFADYHLLYALDQLSGVPPCRALRLSNIAALDALVAVHLFGSVVDNGADALVLWDPVADQPLVDFFDFGAVPAGSSEAPRRFRVKNLSLALTALGVTLSLPNALTGATPSQPAQHYLRLAGDSVFSAAASLAALGPREVSGVVECKRVTASDATAGPWTCRLLAAASSWAAQQYLDLT